VRWPSILDLMPIHRFHLSREREAEYRLALPHSEVAAGGSLRRHGDRCDDRLGLGEQGGGGVVVELSWPARPHNRRSHIGLAKHPIAISLVRLP
jgi:hypothetical protein